MSGFVWRAAAALVTLVVGLAMLVWALELTSLAAFADAPLAVGTSVLLFAGLTLVNLSTLYALTRWSRYLHEHPGTKQLPVAPLLGVLVVAGAAMLAGLAMHSDWVRAQPVVPTAVRPGFVAYEVVFATIVIATLVLLAVRWSPGFRRRPIEDYARTTDVTS